mmetsp:Transcript_12463/g.13569  ORF Transcript_12463/g.13569 Transcript_12463/m.13569 type:complete len:196 (-) Transcript_12463:88-675(-)|eukprot:Skav231762  [mRNA]  locus=scaffold695:202209:202796:- [translate_table: standard]
MVCNSAKLAATIGYSLRVAKKMQLDRVALELQTALFELKVACARQCEQKEVQTDQVDVKVVTCRDQGLEAPQPTIAASDCEAMLLGLARDMKAEASATFQKYNALLQDHQLEISRLTSALANASPALSCADRVASDTPRSFPAFSSNEAAKLTPSRTDTGGNRLSYLTATDSIAVAQTSKHLARRFVFFNPGIDA